MKQFAFIGLGEFNAPLILELKNYDCELVILDKSREKIEQFEEYAVQAFIIERYTQENLEQMLPKSITTIIIDLGDKLEVSALITHYITELGFTNIFVNAENSDQSKILKHLGATNVIFPNKEAAQKLAPKLLSSFVSAYNIMGHGMAVAEIIAPESYIGLSIFELNLKNSLGILIISVKKKDISDYNFIDPSYVFEKEDEIMICGKIENVDKMLSKNDALIKKKTTRDTRPQTRDASHAANQNILSNFINNIFKKKN